MARRSDEDGLWTLRSTTRRSRASAKRDVEVHVEDDDDGGDAGDI